VRLAPSLKRPYLVDELPDIFLQPFYHIVEHIRAGRPDEAALEQSLDIFHHSVQMWPNIGYRVAYGLVEAAHEVFICALSRRYAQAFSRLRPEFELPRAWSLQN